MLASSSALAPTMLLATRQVLEQRVERGQQVAERVPVLQHEHRRSSPRA